MNTSRLLWTILAIATPNVARSQQTVPPVHPVGAIVAKTTVPIGRLAGIHPLSTGRVVVNDAGGRGGTGRVLLFDSTLTMFTVLLDTSGVAAQKYPTGRGGIVVPYHADSTVFFDATAIAFVFFDPQGRIARLSAPPYPPDAGFLMNLHERFDPAGRLVYPESPVPSATRRDSEPVVRATRGAVPETLTYIRVPGPPGREPFVTKEGMTIQRPVIDPFPVVDGGAILPDGGLAILRGQDYHIDWFGADGQRSTSPKIPFQWHRLSDSDKVAIVDSVKGFNESHPRNFGVPGPDGQRVTVTAPAGVISADSLADYRPAFQGAPMLADADGNVWILPTPEIPVSPNPGPVYDVVNHAGKLIDRVQLSPGFGIEGFSPGYVFMSIREDSTTVLVKAKIR
jgi:hypothetical protein